MVPMVCVVIERVRVGLGLGVGSTNNRAICMSKVYMMPQPPRLLVCIALSGQPCCLGRQCEYGVSSYTGDHICCLRFHNFCPCVSRPCAFCMNPGSYSLPDSSTPCLLDTIIASPCFVLQCAKMALKELLTPHSLSLTVLCPSSALCLYSSLYFSFSRLSVFHFFAPDPPALFHFSYMLSVFSPPKSLLSATAMKWQLRGCQCGFSSLLILFQRDLEIQQ